MGLLFSSVTEKLKEKSYQTILNVKDSQKVFADVNFKESKNGILSFNWNFRIYSNIRIFLNIRIYSNMFYAIRIYQYSYSDENFPNEYIRIHIRSWKKNSLISESFNLIQYRGWACLHLIGLILIKPLSDRPANGL